MTPRHKTAEGERLVRERYLAFLKYWPVPNEYVRIATSQGETFVVTCGDVNAPPLLLFHGSAGNSVSVMWCEPRERQPPAATPPSRCSNSDPDHR
jgi:hypothetical protein